MNRIQQWFEHIAGLTQEERQRQAFVAEIFGAKPLDVLALQTPACWRRQAHPSRRTAPRR